MVRAMAKEPPDFFRRLAVLLCILGLVLPALAGCAAAPEAPVEASAPVSEAAPAPEPEPEDPYPPETFTPGGNLTPEETVAAYFEQLYRGYTTFRFIDISAILWLEEVAVSNSVVWNQMLTQRRRLLYDNGLCYVQTEAFPYEIEYCEADSLRDERLTYWLERRPFQDDEIALHFEIKGEAGVAYPPFMPTGAQHTIRLKEFDGVWKITLHYFPGSVRKFVRAGTLELPAEEEMLEDLLEEFSPAGFGEETEPPAGAIPYDAGAATDYALAYTEEANPDFYHVGDWMGNCANFTSQCIWKGFGEHMTDSWYAVGGGSPAWENVKYFWDYIAEGTEMGGLTLEGISEIANGDMIQTAAGPYRSRGGDDADDYSHSMLVVDDGSFLLAQNTPACFVYYSDIVNVRTRFVRPTYLVTD